MFRHQYHDYSFCIRNTRESTRAQREHDKRWEDHAENVHQLRTHLEALECESRQYPHRRHLIIQILNTRKALKIAIDTPV